MKFSLLITLLRWRALLRKELQGIKIMEQICHSSQHNNNNNNNNNNNIGSTLDI